MFLSTKKKIKSVCIKTLLESQINFALKENLVTNPVSSK